MDSNGNTERLLRVAEQQAMATASMAEVQRQNLATVQDIGRNIGEHTRLLTVLTEQVERWPADRDAAVDVIKGHITSQYQQSDGWWRKILVVIGVGIIASNILGAPVGAILENLFHTPH